MRQANDQVEIISPWHDLDLKPKTGQKIIDDEKDVFKGIIEITRNTTAKMEVETTTEFNPIVQDQKKDKTGKKVLRHYGLNPPFNYGMIPQTWENSRIEHKPTGCMGDNDPLDVVDMTNVNAPFFSLPNLKVIGAVCLIDQGELDWKILAIDEAYARERKIRDAVSFSQHHPG